METKENRELEDWEKVLMYLGKIAEKVGFDPETGKFENEFPSIKHQD